MIATPLVSIVLPTFNRAQYLRQTLAAVFAQTFCNWQLIVADDGSGEETRSLLRSLRNEPRVKLFLLAHTGNPAGVRNAALRAADGELIAFLDSDDLWMPEKLQKQVAALRDHPECGWCYTRFVRIDEDGEILKNEPNLNWTAHPDAYFEQVVRGQVAIRTPCVLVRRQLVVETGGFDEALHSCEDYDLWMRLALRSEALVLQETLVRIRLDRGSHSHTCRNILVDRDRSLKKLQGLVHPSQRPVLRRERALNAQKLARSCLSLNQRAAALSALAGSLHYAWRYPIWWRATAGTLMRAALSASNR